MEPEWGGAASKNIVVGQEAAINPVGLVLRRGTQEVGAEPGPIAKQ
jgi:hypothetical protein